MGFEKKTRIYIIVKLKPLGGSWNWNWNRTTIRKASPSCETTSQPGDVRTNRRLVPAGESY